MHRVMLRNRLVVLLVSLSFAAAAYANVDLLFQPAVQAVQVGDIVEIHLFAASDGSGTQFIQSVEAILNWEPGYLELLGVDHGLAGHSWHKAGFPIDPDGLNAGVVTPWTDVPANDGNAYYVALAAVDDPAPVPPSPPLLVTTIRFRALATTARTDLSLLVSYGSHSHTCVLASAPPNTNVTGDISSTGGVVIGAGGLSRLTLEIEEECVANDVVEVELWMRDLTQVVTGFQSFLQYDNSVLQFQGGLSEYAAAPFSSHVTAIAAAEVQPGRLNLDGFTYGAGSDEDALLAILRFSVVEECDWTSIDFREVVGLQSELSFAGTPIPTDLFNSPDFHADLSGPVVNDLEISNVEMDDNCTGTMLFGAAVTDNCCLADADVTIDIRLLTDNADLGIPDYVVSNGVVTGSVSIANLASCPANVQLTVFASDCCGNVSGTPAADPDSGLWSESFAGGGGGAIGNVVHAWDDHQGIQWELSGPTLDHVTLISNTVDGDGNGEKVYETLYVGGDLRVDAGLWGGSGMATAAVVLHRHLTHQVYVGGNVDWSSSWTEIRTYATTSDGPGLTVTGRASFTGQGAGPPPEYPPFLGWNGNGGQWGSITELKLDVSPVAIGVVTDAQPPSVLCRDPFTVQLDAEGLASITPEDVDGGSHDNCGAVTLISVEPNVFGCDDVGDVTVMLTAEDACRNSDACTTTITVEDAIAPTALCRDITVQLDASGNVTIAAEQVDNGSFDACGISTLAVEPDAFTCEDVGTNVVTLTVADVNGNISTCSATVTVEDRVPPTALCRNITVQLDDAGNVAVTAEQIDDGSYDACGIGSLSVAPDAFTCAEVGDNPVTLTVTDVNDNVSTCSATVTVEDRVPPAALCRDVTVQLDVTGNVAITAQQVDDGSHDACGIESLAVDPDHFSCDDVGANAVTLTVTDVNGNASTCIAAVTVEDTVAPIALCRDIVVPLDAAGGAMITAEQVDNGSHDACGIASLSITTNSFTCADIGDNWVTLTVTDVNNNQSTCTSLVSITDEQDPLITCPADIVVEADAGQCYATGVNLGAPTTDDNCGVTSVVNDGPTSFPVGDTVVVWTAMDGAGNTATCEQTVTVTDSVPPTIDCPPDVEVGTDVDQCHATGVGLGMPVTNDNCAVTGVTNDAPAVFPIGDTVVVWTADDGSGNQATCEQTVTVIDDQEPTIACPPDVEVSTDLGACYATNVNLGTPMTSDNCAVTNVFNDAPTSQYPVGDTVVTWTVMDGAGNTATCEQMVRVIENEPPTILCPPDVEVFADAGQCHAADVNLGAPVVDDNCGIAAVTNDAPAQFPVGETIVVWTIVDTANNTETCEQRITVVDNQAPTIVGCPDDILVNADAGGCDAEVAWIEPIAEDNCEIESFSSDHAPGDVFTGTTVVTYTVTDVNGNTTTCVFDVIVTPYNEFTAEVQLQGELYDPHPAVPGDVLERCITFTFYGCDDPIVLEKTMTFNVDHNDPAHGIGSATFDDLECGDYECVTAQDALHSLTMRLDRSNGGLYVNAVNQYAAAFTGAHQLLGGDLHHDVPRDHIDMLDYAVFISMWGWIGDPNTNCATPGPHADVNGDGLVNTADFTFIHINFRRHGQLDCCLMDATWTGEQVITDITLDELKQRGLDDLVVSDLNNDGRLNMDDVAAFAAGARPASTARRADAPASPTTPVAGR